MLSELWFALNDVGYQNETKLRTPKERRRMGTEGKKGKRISIGQSMSRTHDAAHSIKVGERRQRRPSDRYQCFTELSALR